MQFKGPEALSPLNTLLLLQGRQAGRAGCAGAGAGRGLALGQRAGGPGRAGAGAEQGGHRARAADHRAQTHRAAAEGGLLFQPRPRKTRAAGHGHPACRPSACVGNVPAKRQPHCTVATHVLERCCAYSCRKRRSGCSGCGWRQRPTCTCQSSSWARRLPALMSGDTGRVKSWV